ncbi:Crp/Fnr family transcriptional regulator [Bradyrhizobium lablabi]|uniref:Crp/Fnr family transcriptional regulator n=1 Tax=Bradyrhizobium lablabi TaxID=722472 RepID=UPI001BA47AF6|nr:Crp/Fnr family transcriptional regulator [Bradyrhizobium lablabi]MBR1125165.1 Crp/Fnr family transcriptional regulator [Bradyrhizobium lablabi]
MSDGTVSSPLAAGRRAEASETLRVPASMLVRLFEVAPTLARRKFPKGGSLYRQGETGTNVYVVVSGRIGITMLGVGGQELMIDIVGTGALCGEGAAFDGLPRFSSASALEPSEVLVVPVGEFCKLMSADVELAASIAQTIALKQRTLASRLVQVAQASPEVRITELLSQISFPDSSAIVLTHQQIASLIGASRITVTRAMQKLRREGAVRCERGRYELVRPQAGSLTN